jgi:dsRNA-specific ribonuclease
MDRNNGKKRRLPQNGDNHFNPNNRLVTKKFIEDTLYDVIGQRLSIHNLHFYQTAFVHKSVYKKNMAPPDSKEPLVFLQTYESLEFMGDSWLNTIVTDYLYHRFPGQKEGFLTKIRAKIIRENGLIKFSEQLNFHTYAIIPMKMEKTVGRKGAKYSEDIFEAFCGAIIEDLGVTILQLFVKHLLERNVDFNDLILFDDDYKSMLLNLYQRHHWPHPTYTMIKEEGKGHEKQFIMGVNYIDEFRQLDIDIPIPYETFTVSVTKSYMDSVTDKIVKKQIEEECRIYSHAQDRKKKNAENLASKKALQIFGMIV